MKVLIVDSYYPLFVDSLYRLHSGLEDEDYSTQWQTLMDACFGTSDFCSRNLAALGHEATEVVADCEPLQRAWARENGMKIPMTHWEWFRQGRLFPRRSKRYRPKLFYQILAEQIRTYRPDALHIQDMNDIRADFLQEIKPSIGCLTGQIACPIRPGVNFSPYDLVLSSFPHYVDRFTAQGLRSEYFKLAFEPRILDLVQVDQKSHDVVFIGGLSSAHVGRTRFLEEIARHVPGFKVWGYGVQSLEAASPLRQVYQGEAWALDMYRELSRARIALNFHLDVAEGYANNMRLYEATGMKTLLLTDQKENLGRLFDDRREVAAYVSAEDCREKIETFLEDEKRRQEIAEAGQRRTLETHTYRDRMEEYTKLVAPLLA